MKIGLFGGTFNPFHTGHLIMAQDVLEARECDRILFVPCNRPPHKNHDVLASNEHRCRMIEAAIEGEPDLDLSEVEIRRGGTSYTIDTIAEFKGAMPDCDFEFIIGSDSLLELHTWKDIGELLNEVSLAVVARPGYSADKLRRQNLSLPPPWPQQLLGQMIRSHLVDISSTEIRMRVAEGMRIRYLVPQPVEMYIFEHGIYRS